MIDERLYKKLCQYAEKLSKHNNDVQDVVQNSVELLLKHPVKDTNLPNKFYFTLVKRGADRFYFKPNRQRKDYVKINKVKLVQEFLVEDENNYFNQFSSHQDSPEHIVMIKELISRIIKIADNGTLLTPNENKILLKIIDGHDPEFKDRTHYSNMQQKLTKFFK